MFKVLWLLKRKPGISFEQFCEHYENSHSVLGQKYFGHLFLDYRRNYDRALEAGASGGVAGLLTSGYDCIAEWVLRDEQAFDECMDLIADPVIGKIFRDDEEHFLDSSATRLLICDTRDTGPGDGAETLRLQAERTT